MAELNNTSTGQWSEIDANNISVSPDGWPEGTYPNQVEPIGRSNMGAIKRFWDRINGTVTTTGSANAYVYTPVSATYPTAYVAGEIYTFKANFTNTAAATININGLGVKNIFGKSATGVIALTGGEIQNGGIFSVVYDGTQFQLMNGQTTSFDILNINSSVTSGNAIGVTANNLSSGTALSIYSPSTGGVLNGQSYMVSLNRNGTNLNANHSAYGLVSSVLNTGAGSANIAGYFNATGGVTNIALSAPAGNVIIANSGVYTDGAIGNAPLQTTAVTGSNAGFAIRVASGSASTTMQGFVNANGSVGNISTNGSTTGFNTVCDPRAKDYLRPLSKSALSTILKIPVYSLVYKSDYDTRLIGYLSTEIQKVMPEVVTGEADAVDEEGKPIFQSVDHGKFMPAMVACIQELHAMNKGLMERVETLEKMKG
jgi:hypothetical protein